MKLSDNFSTFLIFLLLIFSLNSCFKNKENDLKEIFNFPGNLRFSNDIYIEQKRINLDYKNTNWIYLTFNELDYPNFISDNFLIAKNDRSSEIKLCFKSPFFYNTNDGFWNFQETEFTLKRQNEIVKILKSKEIKIFGGYYNSKLRKFVDCKNDWDGRGIVYLSDSVFHVLIFRV